MAFAFHGNWCGPGWTAGKHINAQDMTVEDMNVEAVDELDAICKAHDIALWQGDDPDIANREFMTAMKEIAQSGSSLSKRAKAGLMYYAVGNFGPRREGTSFLNLPYGARNESQRRSVGQLRRIRSYVGRRTRWCSWHRTKWKCVSFDSRCNYSPTC